MKFKVMTNKGKMGLWEIVINKKHTVETDLRSVKDKIVEEHRAAGHTVSVRDLGTTNVPGKVRA